MPNNNCPKIGIITFHRAISFGAMLQAYALKTIIEKIGYHITVIDHPFSPGVPYPFPYEKLYAIQNKIKFLKSCITYFFYYLFNVNNKRINFEKKSPFYIFLNQKILNQRQKRYNRFNYKKGLESFDCLIVGSDQVWNPKFGNINNPLFFFLHNINVKRKIAYAPSIGDPEDLLTCALLPQIKDDLQKFERLSCRETDGVATISNLINRTDVKLLLDPTLLLTQEDWAKVLIPPQRIPNQKFILVYTLVKKQPPELLELAKNYARTKELTVVCISNDSNDIGPGEFLWYIKNASIIYTNSFHGVAFSINFNKIFRVLLPPLRRNRILTILKNLNLEQCILSQKAEASPIDYQNKLNFLREDSLQFLKDSLSTQ